MKQIFNILFRLFLVATFTTTIAKAENRILGVLFVESDTTSTPQMKAAVLHQLQTVQREWLRNFGRTFKLDDNPVRVIEADHTGYWYANTKSSSTWGNSQLERWWRLENIREEVVRKLKLGNDVRLLVYPTSRRNGKVGAYIATPIGQGGYMDFDDITCVYGAGESTPYDTHEAVCGAHELHEMGHIFGLEHTGPEDDCMQYGFYKYAAPSTPFCKFYARNRAIVKSTQQDWLLLDSLPTTPTPTPTSTLTPTPTPTPTVVGVCRYSDACSGKDIVVVVGREFKDDCGVRYRADASCALSRV